MLPTGGGKTICYQIPGLLLDGLTIVISPLIALMTLQHQELLDKGIKSYHFHGKYTPRQLDTAFRNLRYGKYKFVFMAPERLNNPLFTEFLGNAHVGLIAVDEAHCISQWGFDFRPSYLNVTQLRKMFPEAPVVALTASATDRVKRDIAEQLAIEEATIFEGSIRRANLSLHKYFTPNKERQLLRLLDRLEGTGIIYCKTRRNCEVVAKTVSNAGIAATYYHAGLDQEEKQQRQQAWMNNQVRLMAATTAFGMGIDKSDVKWVIHWDVPDTLEGYYQEVGRGGRNGDESAAYLLYHQGDIQRINTQKNDLPQPEWIAALYHRICSKYQIAIGAGLGHTIHFSIPALADALQVPMHHLLSGIRLLQQRGVWQFYESTLLQAEVLITSRATDWDRLSDDLRETLEGIIRFYPFASEEPTAISLQRLARVGLGATSALHVRLLQLAKKKLLEYTPEQPGSALVFTADRLSVKALHFPSKFIDQWISSKQERANAVLAFLESESCIMNDLAVYFGQEALEKCGKCSNCTLDHYPDEEAVKEKLKAGATLDDIWLDMNCPPDALQSYR